jgi:D,D-heptose 1,7-bisphosphate phosphatase
MEKGALSKAFFLDRDGVLNVDTHFVSRPEDFQLYPFVGDSVRRLNEAGYKAVVITNQSAVSRGICTEDTLRAIHRKMEAELRDSGAYLDGIYYSSYHPDFSNDVAEELRRKPAPGMLLEAAEDLGISLKDSYMVGDNERDIIAGIHAGCKTIAVSTGKGYRRAEQMADYFFRDLSEAVDFVLGDPFLAVCREVLRRMNKVNSSFPYLIRIGGNTGSGKSTLARRMLDYFEEQGMSCALIGLNDWIVPREKRSKRAGMKEVFQESRLSEDLRGYLDGEIITVGGYARHPEHIAVEKQYCYSGERVVIVEGVSAFSAPLEEIAWNLSLAFEDAGYDLAQHVRKMYEWKGFPDSEVEAVYRHKSEVEYSEVSRSILSADLILTPRSGAFREVR